MIVTEARDALVVVLRQVAIAIVGVVRADTHLLRALVVKIPQQAGRIVGPIEHLRDLVDDAGGGISADRTLFRCNYH